MISILPRLIDVHRVSATQGSMRVTHRNAEPRAALKTPALLPGPARIEEINRNPRGRRFLLLNGSGPTFRFQRLRRGWRRAHPSLLPLPRLIRSATGSAWTGLIQRLEAISITSSPMSTATRAILRDGVASRSDVESSHVLAAADCGAFKRRSGACFAMCPVAT